MGAMQSDGSGRTVGTDSAVCIDCGMPSRDALDLNPTGLWCRECELARRARISGQMADITKSLGEARDAQQ